MTFHSSGLSWDWWPVVAVALTGALGLCSLVAQLSALGADMHFTQEYGSRFSASVEACRHGRGDRVEHAWLAQEARARRMQALLGDEGLEVLFDPENPDAFYAGQKTPLLLASVSLLSEARFHGGTEETSLLAECQEAFGRCGSAQEQARKALLAQRADPRSWFLEGVRVPLLAGVWLLEKRGKPTAGDVAKE
jgi:hypothetical protein